MGALGLVAAIAGLAGASPEVQVVPAELNGLPVRGAFVTVEHGSAGARVVASRAPSSAPRALPGAATVGADRAIAIVRDRFEVAPRSAPGLVYVLVLGRPVLAWELQLPLSLVPRPSLPTVWVGAQSGRIVELRDAAWSSRARVFVENPVVTPDPSEVELLTLAVSEPGLPLASAVLEVSGCSDTPEDEPPAWWSEGACFPAARARSDGAGDWFVPLPDVALLADNRAFDDAYAEVAAYHHVERFFAAMAERGLSTRRCERFTVLVNRFSLDDEGVPSPIDGATYVDTCDAEVSPTVLVGQGKDVDYAWDADVLDHELGHSVVQHLAPAGLADRRYASWGIVSEAGAINEGVADYLAMSVSDDPDMGEYVARFDAGSPHVASGEALASCPRDLIGEWHSDGRVVTGALWAMRARLGIVVDELLLRVLPRLPPDAVLEDFGATAWVVAQEMHAEARIDDFALALARRSLAARGLLDCPHVIEDPELATTGKRMHVAAADERITPFAPGPFQLRYRVPDGAHEVTMFFTMTVDGEGEAAASLLVGRAGRPIELMYDVGDDDAIAVTGDHDVELAAESLNGEDFIARLAVTPGEVLHVAFANRSPGAASVSNFFVVESEPFGADPGDEGCGCRSGATGGVGLALAVVALRRRRRAPLTACARAPSRASCARAVRPPCAMPSAAARRRS